MSNAEHIHANCDCTYAVRFDTSSDVEGYEPEKYRKMYERAEGNSSREKINGLRKMINAGNSGNDIDFYAGSNGKTLLSRYREWIGDNKMRETLEACESDLAKAVIRSDFRKTSFIGEGDTASIRRFEIQTGLKCGRNGGDHKQKAEDLIRFIERTLLKNISENDKMILNQRLAVLRKVESDGL